MRPDWQRPTGAGRAAIASTVLPAFARFTKFFNDRYLPACRTSIGISDTPQGPAFYRELIAYHTTTPLTAEQIHAIGLAEVKRIRGEMDEVISSVGFTGDFQAFSRYLRTDPKFFYTDPNDLLHGYMVIAKSIDPNLVALFGKLPRTPFGVRPVPDTSAPNTTTAYYQPLSSDGTRPGYYYVNLYKPEARPKWEMEVLTTHESMPGHHLQTALQFENAAGVSMIRRMSTFTAYVGAGPHGAGVDRREIGKSVGHPVGYVPP
jgi:prolyl oligopeptidase